MFTLDMPQPLVTWAVSETIIICSLICTYTASQCIQMLAINSQMYAIPQLLSCAYSYKYLEVLWLPKRTKLWACFNTEPNRLYRRLRLFPSKLQEYTPPPFSRLSTQYHIDPLLTCFLSLDTSRTSLRLQQSTKFGNRHTARGRYEYSYNLANSRENWAQKKKNRAPARARAIIISSQG